MDYKFRVMAENKVGVSEPLDLDGTVVPKCPYGESSLLASVM